MKIALITAALCFTGSAFAQEAPAKVAPAPAKVEAPAKKVAAPAVAISPEKLKTAEAGIAAFEHVAKAVVDNAANCDAMATAMQKVAKDHGPAIAAVKEMDKTLTQGEKDHFKTVFEPRVKKFAESMMGAMMKCSKNPAVQAAMKSL